MKEVISCLLDVFAILGLIGGCITVLVLLYFTIKFIFLDIKQAENYKEYYQNYYSSKYDDESKRLERWYENQLKEKSKEYFKQFYDDEMAKKKEEKNGN